MYLFPKFFIQPIIERKLLDHPLLATLLENIKTLYNVSGELVTGLKHNPEAIADVFRKLAPFFKLYSVYAYDYTQMLTLLQVISECRTEHFISLNAALLYNIHILS